jgi:hypothetical protein
MGSYNTREKITTMAVLRDKKKEQMNNGDINKSRKKGLFPERFIGPAQ